MPPTSSRELADEPLGSLGVDEIAVDEADLRRLRGKGGVDRFGSSTTFDVEHQNSGSRQSERFAFRHAEPASCSSDERVLAAKLHRCFCWPLRQTIRSVSASMLVSVFLRSAIFSPRAGDDPICDRIDVMEVMADEDAGDALLPQRRNVIQDLVGLLDREMIGRLVQDQDLGFEEHGAGDGYTLALAAGELVDRRLGRARPEIDVGHRGIACSAILRRSISPIPPMLTRSGSRPMKMFRATDICGTMAADW